VTGVANGTLGVSVTSAGSVVNPPSAAHLQPWPASRSSVYATAAIVAAAGIVRIQAHTICPATPQRTADSRLVAPTPTIDPVIACVVLTGTPVFVAISSAIAAPVSAAAFCRFDLAILFLGFALLVLWKHRANIARLIAGTEPKVGRTAA
jgi:glycerol-3-phosphate acyltransferase PlsY